jgi:hypothetical protein
MVVSFDLLQGNFSLGDRQGIGCEMWTGAQRQTQPSQLQSRMSHGIPPVVTGRKYLHLIK